MIAEYSLTPFASNNPLIEALPPMLAGKELIHALACVPPYRESDRELSAGKRLQLLSFLYDFYQPLPMTLDLYCEVYNALQHCYGQYTSAKEASVLQLGYLTISPSLPPNQLERSAVNRPTRKALRQSTMKRKPSRVSTGC